MPLTICSKTADNISVTPLSRSLGGILDFGCEGPLDGRLAVLDLKQDHWQASLIMIVEGHLTHCTVILDLGQGVANLGTVGTAGCLDGLGQQMNRFPMHVGVIVGSLAIFGFELLDESEALRRVPCRQPCGGLNGSFERLRRRLDGAFGIEFRISDERYLAG